MPTDPGKDKVKITIHPLGCLFWLAVFVAFVAALNWAMSL